MAAIPKIVGRELCTFEYEYVFGEIFSKKLNPIRESTRIWMSTSFYE